MRNRQNIEADIAIFFDRYLELRQEDRKRLLMSLFEKHIILNESELVIGKFDFDQIISTAKGVQSNVILPARIEGRTLDHAEIVNMSVMEAFISFLNSKGALRRLPKFNK